MPAEHEWLSKERLKFSCLASTHVLDRRDVSNAQQRLIGRELQYQALDKASTLVLP